jgi:hypothetical protein
VEGCLQNAALSDSLCVAYPDLAVYHGTTAPTLEQYLLTPDTADLGGTKASGELLLLVDSSGAPFGGFTRDVLGDGSPPGCSAKFAAFERQTHDGTMLFCETNTDSAYRAVRVSGH